jgi:hypothetical protein
MKLKDIQERFPLAFDLKITKKDSLKIAGHDDHSKKDCSMLKFVRKQCNLKLTVS